eukprot:1137068-Pelagomonas_calceolata.AAC.6
MRVFYSAMHDIALQASADPYAYMHLFLQPQSPLLFELAPLLAGQPYEDDLDWMTPLRQAGTSTSARTAASAAATLALRSQPLPQEMVAGAGKQLLVARFFGLGVLRATRCVDVKC